MKPTTVLLLSVLLLTASGCASQSQSPSVIALPQQGKPQAPAELMQPEPSKPSSYQKQLNGVFEISQKAPIGKPSGSAPK
jgi:type IV pilus biogenesis protein CpaD/CtpE